MTYPAVLSSPFRTVTVGSGITPDLLDPAAGQQALAGFSRRGIHRRWGIPPRPENSLRKKCNGNREIGRAPRARHKKQLHSGNSVGMSECITPHTLPKFAPKSSNSAPNRHDTVTLEPFTTL